MIAAAYLAPEGLEAVLAEELDRLASPSRLGMGVWPSPPDPPITSVWALDVWTAPREIDIASVKSAAWELRTVQRNWSAYAVAHHRRMALITGNLPPVKARPLIFPEPAPASHLGAWTLLAPNRLLASPTKTSPFVNGECLFEEDHIGPPSRAYLKLWEACTRLGIRPRPGRHLPRSRRVPRRLDLGHRQTWRGCHGHRQGAARPARRRHAGRDLA